MGLNRRTVKRYIENWSKKDPRFAELKYIGQHLITVTLEDIAILNQLLSDNITIRKQEIVREINDKRIKRGDSPIPQATLYNMINNMVQTLTNGAPQEHQWLVTKGIEVSEMYNLADARTTLSNTFIYTGLKIFGGIDIDGIALRLQEAQKWLQSQLLQEGDFLEIESDFHDSVPFEIIYRDAPNRKGSPCRGNDFTIWHIDWSAIRAGPCPFSYCRRSF